jgi:putative transposase
VLEALEIVLAASRKPKIFHSDQSCQFTSTDFVSRLQDESVRISGYGRKRCYDNILIEKLWRTVKNIAEGFSAKPSRGIPTCRQR